MVNSKHKYISNHLENVELVHRENPITYSIPRREQRENLQIGEMAKLVFLIDTPASVFPSAERMWVEVKEIKNSGYVGSLENDPQYISNLKHRDLIEFSPENIAAIERVDEASPIPYEKSIMVSREILDKGILPQFLIREKLIDDQFSGWWAFKSRQTQHEELANRENFVVLWVGEIVDRFRILDSVLNEPGETQWKWNEENLEYEKIV